MNYPFVRKHSQNLTKVLSIAMTVIMLAAMFSGCQKKALPEESTEPSASLNLIESTEPLETETTEAPTEPAKKNAAIVKEQVNVRSSPSMESNIIGQLDAGDEVEINRIEAVSGIQWAYIPLKGWVTIDNLDMTNVSNVTSNNATPANPEATEPEVTPDVPGNLTNNNTNNNSINTGNGQKGVVTASEMNIRSQASTNSDIVGTATYGTRVTILEKSNGWGRTNQGWLSLNYVYLDGDRGQNAVNGVITGSAVNVRSGPGTNYEAVGSVSKGQRVSVLETIKVGNTTWGCISTGWISMDYVEPDGTVTNTDGSVGTVTADTVNVRSGPGTTYDIVGVAKYGDQIRITSQTKVGETTWGQFDKGWISMDFVGMG